MKKEEFPTFLNQQPAVVFGRTGRELLIIVCGIVSGYALWSSIHTLLPALWWMVLSLVLAILPVIISFVVALIPVANRPLEEWAMCWLFYISMPRIFLYVPQEEDLEQAEEQKKPNIATQENTPRDTCFDED